VEFGERLNEALKRELKEELGVSLQKFSFMGVVDNIFMDDGEKHHEFILAFRAKVKGVHSDSREDHIDFTFLSKKDFAKNKIYPIALKKATLKWLKDKKIFWVSQ